MERNVRRSRKPAAPYPCGLMRRWPVWQGVPRRVFPVGMALRYKVALVFLLVCCSNLLLISQRLAVQSSEAKNLVSVRDVALATFIMVSIPSVLKIRSRHWTQPVFQVTVLIVALAIPLAILGALDGNEPREILAEANCVIGWLSGICLFALVDRESHAKFVLNVMAALGVLIGMGVCVEVLLRVPVVTGATGRDTITAGYGLMRSTPSCWPLLCASMAILMARAAGDRALSRRTRMALVGVVGFEAVACFATLSRTLLVAFVVSALGIVLGFGKRRVIAALITVGLLVGAWIGSQAMGEKAMGRAFTTQLEGRYSVFYERDRAEAYDSAELRPQDIRAFITGAGAWLLTGSSLGTPLWKVNTDFTLDCESSDVSVVQIGTRFGLWGVLFLAVLAIEAVVSLVASKHASSEFRWMYVGLASALCGLWVAGLFGNIWSLTYTAPPVMMLFFLSLALRTKATRAGTQASAGTSVLKRVRAAENPLGI